MRTEGVWWRWSQNSTVTASTSPPRKLRASSKRQNFALPIGSVTVLGRVKKAHGLPGSMPMWQSTSQRINIHTHDIHDTRDPNSGSGSGPSQCCEAISRWAQGKTQEDGRQMSGVCWNRGSQSTGTTLCGALSSLSRFASCQAIRESSVGCLCFWDVFVS